MTTAEEIRDGLDFLIKEAKDFDEFWCKTLGVDGRISVDVYTEQDRFHISLLAPIRVCTKDRASMIKAKMEELGWYQDDDDDDPFTFRHLT